MPALDLLQHRRIRIPVLIVVLSATVLAALWQQTSASDKAAVGPIPTPAAQVATTTPTPAPTPPHQPTPSPSLATISDPAGLAVVVNKHYGLPASYIPASLRVPNVTTRYGAAAMQSQLRSEAATALEEMFASAHQAGLELALVSGYRSAAYQASIYQSAVRNDGQAAADVSVARPGHSEHQTGLGADLGTGAANCDIQACFGLTPEGEWLARHAVNFGFIIRYPAGGEALTGYKYEPWHVRYVGTATAHAIQESNQTLESHFGLPAAQTY